MKASTYCSWLGVTLISAVWGLLLPGICPNMSADHSVHWLYDSIPSALILHRFDWTLSPDDSAISNNFQQAFGYITAPNGSMIIQKQAFGYIPAPDGSMIVHTKSLPALHSPHMWRFVIYYPSSPDDSITVVTVGDHMICNAYIDIEGHTLLHCPVTSIVVPVASFKDLVLKLITDIFFKLWNNSSILHLQIAIIDMTSRMLVLSIDLSSNLSTVIHDLCLKLLQQIMLKHDFCILS